MNYYVIIKRVSALKENKRDVWKFFPERLCSVSYEEALRIIEESDSFMLNHKILTQEIGEPVAEKIYYIAWMDDVDVPRLCYGDMSGFSTWVSFYEEAVEATERYRKARGTLDGYHKILREV